MAGAQWQNNLPVEVVVRAGLVILYEVEGARRGVGGWVDRGGELVCEGVKVGRRGR